MSVVCSASVLVCVDPMTTVAVGTSSLARLCFARERNGSRAWTDRAVKTSGRKTLKSILGEVFR